MPDRSVALLTCAALPALDPDDALLVAALAAAGVRGVPVVWGDPRTDLAAFPLAMIRSTWDYTARCDEFLSFLDAAPTRVLNPPAVVRWNAHKRYLIDLANAGVAVAPTTLLPRGARTRLRDLAPAADVVVKPAVSAGARRTHRLRADDDEAQRILDELLADCDVLVQPLLRSVSTEGEHSLVCFAGAVSHCVRKVPAQGDFRVQEEHGGRFAAAPVPDGARALADACLAAVGARFPGPTEDAPLLYARVDLVRDDDGRLVVMELELVEPSLYFAHGDGAAARCAAAIARRV